MPAKRHSYLWSWHILILHTHAYTKYKHMHIHTTIISHNNNIMVYMSTHFEQFRYEISAQTGLLWQWRVTASHRPVHVQHPPSHSFHYHGYPSSQLSVCVCMDRWYALLNLNIFIQLPMATDSMAGFGASYGCMLDHLILCTINKRPETRLNHLVWQSGCTYYYVENVRKH